MIIHLNSLLRPGAYDAGEMVVVVRSSHTYTQQQLQEHGVGCERSIRNIMNSGHNPRDIRALRALFFDRAEPPIPENWDREIASLREIAEATSDDKSKAAKKDALTQLTQLATTTMAPQEVRRIAVNLRRCIRSIAQVTAAEIRHEIGKGWYYAQFARVMADVTRDEPTAQRAWRLLQKLLFRLVARLLAFSNESETPAGKILLFKATVNHLSAAWNLTSPKRRASVHMKTLVETLRYFDQLKAYAAMFYTTPMYVINALAVASRFEWQHEYEELSKLAVKAIPEFEVDPKREIEKRVKDNGDFADYLSWWRDRKEARIPKRHAIRGVAAMGFLLLLAIGQHWSGGLGLQGVSTGGVWTASRDQGGVWTASLTHTPIANKDDVREATLDQGGVWKAATLDQGGVWTASLTHTPIANKDDVREATFDQGGVWISA